MEEVSITKEAIADLSRLTNEINNRVESLELMSDKKFMVSLKKAKEQIKKGILQIGMPYKILPTKEFEKDFKKIEFFMQERIKKKFSKISENPARYKHLHYDLAESCRI